MRSLYILTIAGLKYGVWKDEIESVEKVDDIHQIPFSPPHIAGMVMLAKRGTALVDLAVILGHDAIDRAGSGFMFLVAGQEQQTGFIVDAAIIEREENEKDVKKLTYFLSTRAISSCIVDQGKALPLINIKGIYNDVLAGEFAPNCPSFSLAPRENKKFIPALESIRIFVAGAEKFALNTSRLTCVPFAKENIFPLVNAPDYIVGMVPLVGTILPIIDLAARLGVPPSGPLATLIINEIDGDNFAFLVADDLGEKKLPAFSIAPLPNLAVSPWAHDLALINDELIPVLAAAELVKNDQEISRPKLAEMYDSDNKFGADFEHTEIKVVEFLLLGARHALPKLEVMDVVPVANIRRLSDLQSVVIGVVWHNNEILPVLDLAMVFGRRSIIKPGWQMLLVANGDFKAFVVTEEVGRERLIPQDYHKNVPISLPQRLVYGCYPEDNLVFLILNVQAIAVNFDKVVVKEFISTLTDEMLAAPAEIVPTLLPDADILLLEQNRESVEKHEQELMLSGVLKDTEPAAEDGQLAIDITKEAETLLLENALSEDAENARIAEEESRIAADEEACKVAEKIKVKAEETTRIAAEESRIAADEEACKVEEQRKSEVEETGRIAEKELCIAAEEEARKVAEKRKADEAESARIAAEELCIAAEESRLVNEDAAREEDEQRMVFAAEERKVEARAPELREMMESETKKQQAEIDFPAINVNQMIIPDKEEGQRRGPNHGAVGFSSSENVDLVDSNFPVPFPSIKKSRTAQKGFRIAVVFCILVGILFLGVLPFHLRKKQLSPLPQKKIIYPELVQLGRVDIISAPKPEMDETRKQAKDAKPALPVKENISKALNSIERPPIIAIVPQDTIIKKDSYVVKKGDTLWHISGEMTGDPHNFPKVADENSILNPDLIFPAQKIIIRKETSAKNSVQAK